MKKIGIMADSHSGILKQEAEELDIQVLPMPFYLNGELFHEDSGTQIRKQSICGR